MDESWVVTGGGIKKDYWWGFRSYFINISPNKFNNDKNWLYNNETGNEEVINGKQACLILTIYDPCIYLPNLNTSSRKANGKFNKIIN